MKDLELRVLGLDSSSQDAPQALKCGPPDSHVIVIGSLPGVGGIEKNLMNARCPSVYSPPEVDRIGGIWGSYYNISKAIFYLLKGDYSILKVATRLSAMVFSVSAERSPGKTMTSPPPHPEIPNRQLKMAMSGLGFRV